MVLANFDAACLLTGAPHAWTARWEPSLGDAGEWCECSYAAITGNGTPTHWAALPRLPLEAKMAGGLDQAPRPRVDTGHRVH